MANRKPTRPRPPLRPPPSAIQHEIVDPRWLLKAFGLSVAVAAVLGYLSICWLVHQGAWQYLLHPTHNLSGSPAVPFDGIRFDAAADGKPRLAGWWIPADQSSSLTTTVLVLHDGSGTLPDELPALDLLHQAGLNVFAFDYRGFGQSDPAHPSEARMREDADAALDYLENTRHLSSTAIVIYGDGLGAALAASLAAGRPELPALILDNPDPAAFERVATDRKTALVPMRLLDPERFDLGTPLAAAAQPKLLLAPATSATLGRATATQDAYRQARSPKLVVTLSPADAAGRLAALRRFLDEYLPHH